MTGWVEICGPGGPAWLAASTRSETPALAPGSLEAWSLLNALLASRNGLRALRRNARQLGLPGWATDADNAQLAALLRRKAALGQIVVHARKPGTSTADGGHAEPPALVRIDYGKVRALPRDEAILQLPGLWLDDHYRRHPTAELAETTTGGFSYLFDLAAERLVAAYGISRGKHAGPRPSTRMKGHPLSAGPLYHRGHAIPHTLGGGTDINLLAQRGSINVGPFRVLEQRAVSDPGAFYFSYWYYAEGTATQMAQAVDQGLLSSAGLLEVRAHGN